jgi:hypothetical protein
MSKGSQESWETRTRKIEAQIRDRQTHVEALRRRVILAIDDESRPLLDDEEKTGIHQTYGTGGLHQSVSEAETGFKKTYFM